MTIHIPFINRARSDDGPSPEQTNSQFMEFSTLCNEIGVAEHVNEVCFERNTHSFQIDVDEDKNNIHVGDAIKFVAERTLPQFEIFGIVYHMLDEYCKDKFKYCPRCKETLPRSEFGKDVSRKDGLQAYCKKCKNKYISEKRKENKERKSNDLKHCTRCDEWLDKGNFQKNKTMIDGLQRWCAKCNAEYDIQRRKGKVAAMKQHKFNAIYNGLSSIQIKVYETVPISVACYCTQILDELKRVGHQSERGHILWCLSQIATKGLIKEPRPGMFIRVHVDGKAEALAEYTQDDLTEVNTQSNDNQITIAINNTQEYTMQNDNTTATADTAANQTTDPIEKISQLTSQCQAIVAAVQQLASSIETVAIEVQESFSAKDAESQKLKQLQQLLNGLV